MLAKAMNKRGGGAHVKTGACLAPIGVGGNQGGDKRRRLHRRGVTWASTIGGQMFRRQAGVSQKASARV